TVNPVIAIAPGALPGATAATPYNRTLTVTGGTTPYTAFAVNGFTGGTTGLTFANITTDPAAGTIIVHGTPSGAGNASFTVNVTDTAGGTLTRGYTIAVNAALSSAPTDLPTASVGVADTQTTTV